MLSGMILLMKILTPYFRMSPAYLQDGKLKQAGFVVIWWQLVQRE